ncbi:MAG: RNA 2',3'-cyclic phosphodiesterase [Chloroflexi bacterium]|uniref:RNA 2',3'-cyclic phosphodiesterase n=1 Tax=Candidatus Chlorohelix allophototropha TaxID=3003348 RepID=A0A8T7M769_9CHLR|nr:RNA 2',3'-cyclic phosphodiesterase [Chloroflexota bacterium]WJW69795.1 RNA 2',3'-cyclic phosphodiesterase [Chloroflexota bacterium L227-S17]
MNDKETIRCFVALELPPVLKQELTTLITELQQLDRNRKVRWVRPDGIHLTLKFLGEVAAPRLPEIISVTENALAPVQPFSLIAAKLGVFPRADAPRVIWVGLDGNLKALAAAQQAVEKSLVPLGFAPETRPFSPHLTLGRVPDIGAEEKRRLGQLLQTFSGKNSFGHYRFEEAVLMQSTLLPDGAIYTPLAHFKFEGAAP